MKDVGVAAGLGRFDKAGGVGRLPVARVATLRPGRPMPSSKNG